MASLNLRDETGRKCWKLQSTEREGASGPLSSPCGACKTGQSVDLTNAKRFEPAENSAIAFVFFIAVCCIWRESY